MRTTVNLDPDVERAVDRLRREKGLGLSAAVNALARAGADAAERPIAAPFEQRTADLGLRIDVTNVGEVLDMLDAER